MASGKEYKFDAFISHSSKDSDYCYELTEKLEAENFKCFMYERDVLRSLLKDIVENIDVSRRVILVITKNFLASKWGLFETLEAVRKTHREKVVAVIPVLHEVDPKDCPHYLKPYRYFQTSEPDFYQKLKQAIVEDRASSILIPAGDVAHGLCWSYFYGFLKLVLPGIRDRCTSWLEAKQQESTWPDTLMKLLGFRSPEKPKQMLKKMIIIIPTTCYCPKSMAEFDPEHFKHTGFIDYRATRAGNIQRDYKSSVHTVTDPETGEEFIFISEFATPLLSMYEMEQGQIAGLTKEEMFHQRMLFTEKLRDILWHPDNEACHHRATIVEYNNDTDENAKKLASIVCDHIRKELRAEQEIEQINSEMESLSIPNHD